MMKFSYVATELMIFINCCVTYVQSIRCYQCWSNLQERCDQLVGNEYLLECLTLTNLGMDMQNVTIKVERQEFRCKPYCRKISQALYFTTNYEPVIIRECAYFHKSKDECYTSPFEDSKVTTCECRKEGCNSSHSIHNVRWWTIYFCIYLIFRAWTFLFYPTF